MDSHAPATVSDPELLSYEDGMLHALKDGVGTVRIAIDGKQCEFTVRVGQEETQPQESATTPTVVDRETAARDNEATDRTVQKAVIAGALILVIAITFLFYKKRKIRRGPQH